MQFQVQRDIFLAQAAGSAPEFPWLRALANAVAQTPRRIR
jgi:hypothetical protein